MDDIFIGVPLNKNIAATELAVEGGSECGEDRGKALVVVRPLHGLKSSGAS